MIEEDFAETCQSLSNVVAPIFANKLNAIHTKSIKLGECVDPAKFMKDSSSALKYFIDLLTFKFENEIKSIMENDEFTYLKSSKFLSSPLTNTIQLLNHNENNNDVNNKVIASSFHCSNDKEDHTSSSPPEVVTHDDPVDSVNPKTKKKSLTLAVKLFFARGKKKSSVDQQVSTCYNGATTLEPGVVTEPKKEKKTSTTLLPDALLYVLSESMSSSVNNMSWKWCQVHILCDITKGYYLKIECPPHVALYSFSIFFATIDEIRPTYESEIVNTDSVLVLKTRSGRTFYIAFDNKNQMSTWLNFIKDHMIESPIRKTSSIGDNDSTGWWSAVYSFSSKASSNAPSPISIHNKL